MIVYDNNKEYRNLQEQVAKNQDDIETIKQALGNALPDPIEGPQGEPGERGPAGPEGPRGNTIKTVGLPLPSPNDFKEGDLALVIVSPEVGNLYKVTAGRWVLQCNIRGAQGVPGPKTQVIVNPVDPATDVMYKLKIDGVTYDFDTGYVRCIGAPASTTLTNAEKQTILGGCFVNGEFLGYTNPVFFPATQSGSYYYGVIMGPYNGTSYTIIGQYQINPDNSIVERGVYGNIELRCLAVLNGKTFPQYPNSSGDGNKYDFIYGGDGELYWHRHGNVDNLTLSYNNSTILEAYADDPLSVDIDGPGGASDLNFNDFNSINLLTQGSGQVNIGIQDQGGDLYVYGDAEVDGGLYVGASLRVGNDITVDNDINVAGDVQCDTLNCDNQALFNNDVQVTGDFNVHGNIAAFDGNNNLTVKIDPQNAIVYSYTGFQQYDSVAQTYKKVNDLSQIVDSDGHRRFQSFGLTMNNISGITWGYCDCVLNGHELKIVISGQVANGTSLAITDWGSVILPTWIYQVLQPVIPNSDYLSVDHFSAYYNDWNTVYMELAPYKSSGNELGFYFIQTPSFSQDATFRYEQSFII